MLHVVAPDDPDELETHRGIPLSDPNQVFDAPENHWERLSTNIIKSEMEISLTIPGIFC